MRRPLYILGSSGHAKEVAMIARQFNSAEKCWDIMGFISQSKKDIGKDLGIGKIIGDDEWFLAQNIKADLILGVGHPKIREKIVNRYLDNSSRFCFPNLIHHGAIIDMDYITLGQGNVIMGGVSLTCDITIGDFNLLNPNTTIGHDAVIGNFNVINPGANVSGWVQIGDRILVGVGSKILERLTIGSNAVIGGGAMVIHNVGESQTVAGIPAKPVKKDGLIE